MVSVTSFPRSTAPFAVRVPVTVNPAFAVTPCDPSNVKAAFPPLSLTSFPLTRMSPPTTTSVENVETPVTLIPLLATVRPSASV